MERYKPLVQRRRNPWNDPEERQRRIEARREVARRGKNLKRTEHMKELWADPEYRSKVIAARRASSAMKSAAKERNAHYREKYLKTLAKARETLASNKQKRQQTVWETIQKLLHHADKQTCIAPFGQKKYPVVFINGEFRAVHRYVCEAVHGPAPSFTHQALHSCGNGHLGCVNPHHLRWGTVSDNSQDMLLHGNGRNQFGEFSSFPETCSREGCTRKCYAKGLCNLHYQQDRRAHV